jgi:indolepyruvate ferredoxin oxidoreductase alpha subunit
MKELLTGNEAIARGAYEAGVTYASAYPGTPSTEILETMAGYKEDLIAEWAPNEKVALESVIGASMAGARTLAAMKHVGVNVAADPLFTLSYTGITGGLVLVSADDPGCHSSQNEQDNRRYARFAKIPCIEPSDAQEAKDFTKAAFDISEQFDVPILLRMTTRVCHSKGLVELEERKPFEMIPYVKHPTKYISAPANAIKSHPRVENRLKQLEAFSNQTTLNRIEWGDRKIGIITSGVSYTYSKEVFGENASYFKIGFSFPLPMEKIKAFAKSVETLYIIEELEPVIEEQLHAAGIPCIGKAKIPNIGELNPDIISKSLLGIERPHVEPNPEKMVNRPPTLCAGCPHRGFFYTMSKKKDVMITGDIGCYTLGAAEPLNATDSVVCMGASISMGHGAAQAFAKNKVEKRVVSVIGDSTFFHTGINSLIHVAYNKGNTVNVILDNRITGMTGHQENPGTGYTLQGDPTNMINIPDLVKSIGIEHVITVNPLHLKEMDQAMEEAFAYEGPSVVITRWPCVLKRRTQADIQEFGKIDGHCEVNVDKCKGCRVCTRTGCPAISFDLKSKKAQIDPNMCVGCEVCLQACPFEAIERSAHA